MIDSAMQRWSWASSVGAHAVLLLLLLTWGSLTPPKALPQPEPIRLTIIDFPGKTGPAGAPGPAKQQQLAKAAARPAPVPAPPQAAPPVPSKAQTRSVSAPRSATQTATKPAPAKVTQASEQGDWQVALAKRRAEMQAKSQDRLSAMGADDGGGMITGSGGGDAGQAGGELAGRHLIHRVEPRYPSSALADRASGRVTLSIVVGANGRVRSVSVVGSSGDARLDAAARDAIAQWRFAPLPDDLPATDAQGNVPVSFVYRRG